ncbi:hypothetical protein V1J52_15850 [Streptomyces sp. TRM 70351]|uniref:hypothetical protein n=1 Tax=Streptomyces sp. TRM 70351 TaxID=3116552 RepID=UPI002E7BC348|nr:hypothetical protein [Streptomyces sp. TRM 70351]MEE1929640.1 hypothetical protein [Streptomyces sp. TRM 70351]
MSSASVTPAVGGRPGGRGAASSRGRGATAVGPGAHPRHLTGDALRAVKVFARAAFDVAVLGEAAEDAGARHRTP